MAFGAIHGGVLCKNCRAGKNEVATVNAGVLRTMAQLADPLGQAWRRIEIDPRLGAEMRGLLNHYVANLLGRKPRMHEHLEQFWTSGR